MARKTVLKLLLSKYAPKSIQMQQALTFDQAVVKNDLTTAETIEDAEISYVDNEQPSAKEKLAEIAENNL
jgi:recombination protein RecT